MKQINEQEFRDLVNNGTAVVQFSATWCGPCKVLTKLIEANADKFKQEIVKVDIDDAQALARTLGIRSVPTIIRFDNKQETKRLVGNQPIEQLIDLTV